jgi:hypothetical protein
MRLDCANVEEAIWNSVRDGTEPAERHMRHIASCESCSQAMAEALASVEALTCLKPCPPAPDCRREILSRISSAGPRRFRLRLAWAAACVAFAAVAFVALHHGQPISRDAQAVADGPTVPVLAKRHISRPKPDRASDRAGLVASAQPQARHRTRSPRRRHRPIAPTQALNTVRMQCERTKSPTPARLASTESKLITITCRSEPTDDAVSYESVEVNEATGVVTTRYIRRTADSVDIRVETAPPIEAPSRGMSDHKEWPEA